MKFILFQILLLLAAIITFSYTLSCFRSKDLFAKIQNVKVISLYGFNLLIFAYMVNYFDTATVIKSLAIIIVNSYATLVLLKTIINKSSLVKVKPDCEKVNINQEKDYNGNKYKKRDEKYKRS